MTIPTLLFALLIALLYGALYHLIRDGGVGRLFLYLGLGILGFALGHFVGAWRGWSLMPLGSLDFGMASIGSIFILVIGDWLSRIETEQKSKV
jgi:uncharacterized membrane protein YeaQ/YmgE (transglycosylase-associated protein family)